MRYASITSEAFETYDVRVKKYNNSTLELTYYDKSIMQKKEGFEPLENDELPSIIEFISDVVERVPTYEIRDDSYNRSFVKLMDYAICNADIFCSFITLTFAENVTSIEDANKVFSNWTRQMRRVKDDFAYLGVPEFQKRGAVHYHLMTNLECNSEFLPIQKECEGNTMYDVKYWNVGFSSAWDLKLTDDNFNVGLYLTKYFYKDKDNRLFGHKKLLKSNNLKCPEVTKMNSDSKEFRQLIEYLVNNKYFVEKEKDIEGKRLYAHDMKIVTFSNKV